ncbi:hypothetical protein UlMin_007520 [Ulmus minor]
MLKKMNNLIIFSIAILSILSESSSPILSPSSSQDFLIALSSASVSFASSRSPETPPPPLLEYDFYRKSCPDAERIVGATMAQIYLRQRDVSAALLRLFFHDCFVHGCDASVLLDDSGGNASRPIEKQAIPNRTLRGFEQIYMIKEELERVCPGVVSCADIISLATRDGVVLAGGPFFPVYTGRKDSRQSFFREALTDIPRPDGDINDTLQKFSLKGFSVRDTVSLLGAHNIGRMSCNFIHSRLFNFNQTGQPDPTLAPDFLIEMRTKCGNDSTNRTFLFDTRKSSRRGMIESAKVKDREKAGKGMMFQQLLSSVQNGAGFDTHYYQSLLNGRGVLYADQQLMADERTARLVRAYASDDGKTFRTDFARAMVKMSSLQAFENSQGVVRLNCSLPLFS